jgi:K+:H+ antiporter
MAMTAPELTSHLFLEIGIILIACRACGLLARQLGQPPVVGEMVAGVLLGPTLLGALAPGLQSALFPRATTSVLYALSQLGVVFYMFVVAASCRTDAIRRAAPVAVGVAVAGIVVPFAVGCLLAAWLWGQHHLFGHAVTHGQAMIFLGAALSTTAFPVLARILHERSLTGTQVGTIALAAGSITDAAAWCMLAVVLSSLAGTVMTAALAVGGAAIYVAAVSLAGRPLLRMLDRSSDRHDHVTGSTLTVVMLLLLAAWFTDTIGLHAVFGAFVLGLAMPRGQLTDGLRRLLEPLTACLLVPLFFTYSGLNTSLGLVIAPSLLAMTAAVLVVACLCKGVSCWLAARSLGQGHREAMQLGALMNARGLMELILLNIGLSRGLITPALFSVLVVMAIGTTLLTTPLFDILGDRRTSTSQETAQPAPAHSWSA